MHVARVSELTAPGLRSEASIKKSRMEQMEHLLNSKAAKVWDVDKETATGVWVLSGRFVGHHQERPAVFAAASDVDNAAMVDLFAVKKSYPTACFESVAAFSQAGEQGLVFLEPPVEHLETLGRPVVWQCLKV